MAEKFVTGSTYETFKDDNFRLYAVIRCPEIISEASRRRVWTTLTKSVPPLLAVIDGDGGS